MSEDVKLMDTKLEEVAKNVANFQKALDVRNGETSDKLEGLSKNIAGGVEDINTIKSTIDKQDEVIKNIEKQINRLPAGEDNKQEDALLKQDFCKYIRKGAALSEDSIGKITDYLTKATYSDSDAGWLAGKALEMKSLMVGNDPNGGFLVRPTFSNKVLERTFETSPMRTISTVESIGSESIEYVIDDEEFSTGGWVSEVQSRPDTDNGQVGMLSIHTHEQYAQPKATQKMLDDASFNIENWIQRKVSDKFSRTENTAFVIGDGSGKPKGILAYPAWAVNGAYERGKVEQRNSGTAGSFTGDNLIELQTDLKEFYQTGAAWLMKRKSWTEVLKAKDGVGSYLLNPLMLAQGAGKILLGSGVTFADDMPAIANDALSIAYGNFREGYTIVDRIGMRILRDPYTNKPYIRFYTTKRVGGAVTNYESFKILKLAV